MLGKLPGGLRKSLRDLVASRGLFAEGAGDNFFLPQRNRVWFTMPAKGRLLLDLQAQFAEMIRGRCTK